MRNPLIAFLLVISNAAFSQEKYVTITECIIENGEAKNIKADYNSSTGQKSIVVNGVRKPLDEAYPLEGKGYVAKVNWYTNNDSIKVKGITYKKYGLPRVFSVTEVTKGGNYQGYDYFVDVEKGAKQNTPEVIYLPVRRGCEFAPYQRSAPTCVSSLKIEVNAKEVKKGENIVATIKTPQAGKLKYEWFVNKGAEIVGDWNGKSVTISTKNMKYNNSSIMIDVTAFYEGKKCFNTAYEFVAIK